MMRYTNVIAHRVYQRLHMKPIPIGISDYKKIVDGNYYYVDKTLLVQDIMESGEVVQICRPRRY
jgi:hypothetical protein